jgi:hypothetical protein
MSIHTSGKTTDISVWGIGVFGFKRGYTYCMDCKDSNVEGLGRACNYLVPPSEVYLLMDRRYIYVDISLELIR